MAYSQNLCRNIAVSCEMANHFYEVEFGEALGDIPGFPEVTPEDIHEAAARGNLGARLVIETAYGSGPLAEHAREWLGCAHGADQEEDWTPEELAILRRIEAGERPPE